MTDYQILLGALRRLCSDDGGYTYLRSSGWWVVDAEIKLSDEEAEVVSRLGLGSST